MLQKLNTHTSVLNPHAPVFNRTIYNTLIERYQLDFVFTYADALYFRVTFENASLDEIRRIVEMFTTQTSGHSGMNENKTNEMKFRGVSKHLTMEISWK